VAGQPVTYTRALVTLKKSALPATMRFKSCTGLASCGVEERFRNGVSLHWELCPEHNDDD
jgi:hypothetical protein